LLKKFKKIINEFIPILLLLHLRLAVSNFTKMRQSKLLYFFLSLLFSIPFQAQTPKKWNSVDIYHQIEKLNFLGSVLYLAAHPDDENTRLISYFSNEVNARTAYLSLTRGDGGQNLIGPELRELLGVIRTQELIEARKIDGGQQFFSRANDFGYSKNPEETLKIWDKNLVLSDIVWIIRKFRPDVIINRFDHRSPGTTHGHHTSSAMLSFEAFDLANDKNSFSDQLQKVTTWQPKRLFFNTSWWFYGSRENFEKADKTNLSQIPIGVYYEKFGKSNQEIAALSRSRHQSQGFGTSGNRGEETEYIEYLKGDKLTNSSSVFEGIDTSWNRVEGGKAIEKILSVVQKNFDFKNPSSSVFQLVTAYQLIQNLNDEHWKKIKSEEITEIIGACCGLYLDATTNVSFISNGKESVIKVNLEMINRSEITMQLISLASIPSINFKQSVIDLPTNKSVIKAIELEISKIKNYTEPYYLKEKGTVGMYAVSKQENIGKPDVLREVAVKFNISINDIVIPFERNVVYKYNDDVKGEIYQPLDIVPVITSRIDEQISIFPNGNSKKIHVKLTAAAINLNGKISLNATNNWKVVPSEIPFSLIKIGEEKIVEFTVTPPKNADEIVLKSIVTIDGEEFNKEKIEINYPHIFKQTVLKSAEAKAIKLDIKTNNEKIAYIMGAGDEVPASLKQMGYEVSIISPSQISKKNLENFDVVITGIRAYNVINELAFKQDILLNFVKNGKTMIVQYNTLDDLVAKNMAPYSLKISRDRVTNENAEVTFLDTKNSLLNYPNKITKNDFEGWTQEQGLYYPNEWDSNFIPIIASNDEGESSKKGAILATKFGKGTYIYTGLSFFRELPEGVAGAFRLMANLISAKN
jgi:LmbE family N-acetylglucosaminyl deacetylase